MTDASRPGVVRLSAALLVLAALFHVQWLAACEYMSMSSGESSCCTSGSADHGTPCERQARSHECVTPFAKGASGVKLPERADAADPDFQAIQFAGLSDAFPACSLATGPPPTTEPVAHPDGRSLYLSSSRLRL